MLSKQVSIDEQTSVFLNCLRSLSAFLVLTAHTFALLTKANIIQASVLTEVTYTASLYGVMIFFILSGFLICTSILKNYQLNSRKFDWMSYLKNRLLRLYPPLILALVITWILDPYENVAKNYVGSLFFIQGLFWGKAMNANSSLWSLSYEFYYYVLALFAAMIFLNRKYILGSLGFVFLIFVLFISPECFKVLWSFLWTPAVLILGLVWLFGFFLGLAYHLEIPFKENIKRSLLFACPVTVTLIAYLLNDWGLRYLVPQTDHTARSYFILVLFSLLITIAMWFVIEIRNFRYRNFAAQLISRQHFYTYTLYAIHYPILLFGTQKIALVEASWIRFLLTILLVLILISLARFVARFAEDVLAIKKFFKITFRIQL